LQPARTNGESRLFDRDRRSEVRQHAAHPELDFDGQPGYGISRPRHSSWQGMLLDVMAACGVAECCYSCSLSAVDLE